MKTFVMLLMTLIAAEETHAISIGRSYTDVFHISNGRYTFTFKDAQLQCASLKARLATKEELENAQRNSGMDECRCGFVSDGSTYYPITTTLKPSCGGSKPGVRSCGKKTKADVYCYKAIPDHDSKKKCPENHIYWAILKACKLDYCKAGHCRNNKCRNRNDRAISCHCPKSHTFNPKTKKCFNYCHKGACPPGARCRTLTRGSNKIQYKKCDCPKSFPIYWRKENKCARNWCHRGWPCGRESCYNSVKWAHCRCPAKKKFVRKSKSCEAQKCQIGGETPVCWDYRPECKRTGRKVCDRWTGGCWGAGKQVKCCNFC